MKNLLTKLQSSIKNLFTVKVSKELQVESERIEAKIEHGISRFDRFNEINKELESLGYSEYDLYSRRDIRKKSKGEEYIEVPAKVLALYKERSMEYGRCLLSETTSRRTKCSTLFSYTVDGKALPVKAKKE